MTSIRNINQNPRRIILHKLSQANLNKTLKNNNKKNEQSYQNIPIQTNHSRTISSNKHKNSKRQLNQIPRISNPEMVLSIDFGHNKILGIPRYIQDFVQIKQINLQNNCICRIDHIFNLKKLQKLFLAHNRISQIPRQIIKLSQLQLMDLSFNSFCFISQIQPLEKLYELRKQLNGDLFVNFQGNQVFRFKKQLKKIIKSSQWTSQRSNAAHKSSDINTSLEDLSLIINNSNKTQSLGKCLENKIQNKKLNSKQPRVVNQKQIICYQSKQNYHYQSKENYLYQSKENYHNQNINKNSKNSQVISPLKQSINKNQNNKIKINQQKSTPDKQLSLLNCQNSSLLLSPNFKQSINVFSTQNTINKKIINDSQFKDIAQQNKKIIDNLAGLNKKFNLLKQLQSMPNNVKALYQQNTQIVLQQMSQFQLNFSFFTKAAYIFQIKSLQQFQNCFSKVIIQNQQSTKTIQANHQLIINHLANNQTCEIHWYKTWLYQYSKFKQISNLLFENVSKFVNIWKKYLRISQILNINFQVKQASLEANQKQEMVRNSKIVQTGSEDKSSQIRLQKLLFSKQKSQMSKQSSIKKRSYPTSQKKKNNFQQIKHNFVNKLGSSCFQCLLKDQQILNLKRQIQNKLQILEVQNKENQKQKKQMKIIKENKQLYQKIESQQKVIIQQLDGLSPSTYSYILLQQAKAIQSMFLYQKEEQTKNDYKPSLDLSIRKGNNKIDPVNIYKGMTKNTQNATTTNNRQSHGSNSLKRLQNSKSNNIHNKTAFTNVNEQYYAENEISQFVLPIEEQDEKKSTSKINYFKNVDKYNEHKSSIQTKNKVSHQKLQNKTDFQNNNLQDKKQKNIFQNSRSNTQNEELNTKKKRKFQSQKQSNLQFQKQSSNCVRSNSNKPRSSITDKSQTKTKIQKDKCSISNQKYMNGYQSFKTQEYICKLMNKQADQTTEKKQGSLLKSNSSCISHLKEWPHKNQYNYTQLQLQEKKQYKKYIDYHLRNNIESILKKKQKESAFINEKHMHDERIHNKYLHEKHICYASSDQKLTSINKMNPIFIRKEK